MIHVVHPQRILSSHERRCDSRLAVAAAVIVFGSGCELPKDPVATAVSTPPTITFAKPPTLVADGASLATIQLAAVAPPPQLVGLVTTGGIFPVSGSNAATVTLIADTATAVLKAPTDTGPIVVSASIGGALAKDTIPVKWAYPQAIAIAADSATISDTAGRRTITVSAIRHPGVVTRGTLITFSAPVGTFDSPPRTDTTGTVVVHYTLAGAGKSGPDTITATVDTNPPTGKLTISATLVLFIIGPAVPRITPTNSTPAFNGTVGGVSPPAQTIAISNGGTGVLSGLSIGPIVYAGGQPTGWLVATLSPGTAPSVLTLTVTTGTLTAGVYTVAFTISSTSPGVANSPTTITVTFTVM
jgi:hypothetical protein